MPRLNAPPISFLLIALAACAAGCAGAPSGGGSKFVDREPLPADTMTVPLPETGIYGGRFVIAATSAPRTFNALMANESSSTDITERLFVGLAMFDNATQKSTPMIARSWDVSPDGLTWTFHLRHGARFSDGHPLTADDVLFSFAAAYDTVLSPSVQSLITIDGRPIAISAPDSYTVIMRAPRRHAVMLGAVSSVPIMPKHVLEGALRGGRFASAYNPGTAPESVVTSGPWKLAQVLPGEKVVLTRNPYWFGVDAKGHRMPYLDELVYLSVPDQNTAALKFKAGEIDALDNVKPEDYQTYRDGQKAGNYTLYDLGPSLNTLFVWFNLNRVEKPAPGRRVGEPAVGAVKYAWFSDPRFRRAVSMAIDRDAIIRSVFFNDGMKNWAVITPAAREWYDASLTGPDYDPAQSRKLLAEMGLRDRNGDGVLEDAGGHPVTFTIKTNSDNTMRVQMMNFVKDDLAKVGIRCMPQPLEMKAVVSNIREDFQYEAMLLGLGSAVPPDPGMAANVYRSSGITHFWHVRQRRPATPEEARIDSLIEANVTGGSLAERKQTYAEMTRILDDQAFFIWMPVLKVKIPVRNGFGNLHPTVIPHRVLWNIDRVFAQHPKPAA